MISILFTTSEKPLARLIRWATGEDCSHTAINWDGCIFQANARGVNTMHIDEFLKENIVIHTVVLPDHPDELDRIGNLATRLNNSPYDIGALLFCGFVLFCRKALNLKSWPKMNFWQSSGMYMCTEFVTEYLNGGADSMITPQQLYDRISNIPETSN